MRPPSNNACRAGARDRIRNAGPDYEGVRVAAGLRLDLLVEKSIVLEIKAVEKLLPIHQSQLLTYLKLADLRLGLLINFNVDMFKQGVRRIIR